MCKRAVPSKSAACSMSAVTDQELSKKGLSADSVSLLGAIVIGVSCVAPAYTLTAALGPTVSTVGFNVPAVMLAGFIPMLFVAFGYRELNKVMPDSGTSFTWATRAFGPWIGWMAGWGLIAATILVLSNLAGIAVDFLYLLISQVLNKPEIASLTADASINVATCLAFMLVATVIAYRGMQTTQLFQYLMVSFQVVVLLLFAAAAFKSVVNGTAFDPAGISLAWFDPFEINSFSAFAAGLSLSIFIFWGWDVTLTMNEETKGSRTTPGLAATLTIIVIVLLYLLVATALLSFAGIGDGEYGLGNSEAQENVFFALANPVLGPLALLVSIAVLSSSMASLQSTIVSPARTLLAMGHYRALPGRFARVSDGFLTPGYATIFSSVVASVFYAVMRFVSENVLWDTITALGMMICFYYGLTAFAAVWYFRRQAFATVQNFFFQLLFPLIGGAILVILFITTAIDSMDPDYGSGSHIGGVGLVFLLGTGVILLGVVLMVFRAVHRPAFFRGEIISRGVSDTSEDGGIDDLSF